MTTVTNAISRVLVCFSLISSLGNSTCLGNLPKSGGVDHEILPQTIELKRPGRSRSPRIENNHEAWIDVRHNDGFEIRLNIAEATYRTVDPRNRTLCEGTFPECLEIFEKKRASTARKSKLEEKNKYVVLVHGLKGHSGIFRGMLQSLRRGGFVPIPFDYPSTRVGIDTAGEALARVVVGLEHVETIHFVGHSMGGLVTRSCLSTDELAEFDAEKLGRIMMLGTPNQGAFLATMLKDMQFFQSAFGKSGQQLTQDYDGLIARLPVPRQEFAIIAGGRGDNIGYSPIIPGDDDGTVAVKNTALGGASDFALITCLHPLLVSHRDAIQGTVSFLTSGAIRPNGQRQPIPPEVAKTITPSQPDS